MNLLSSNPILLQIEKEAQFLSNSMTLSDELMSSIGDAKFVLLGEATHGTKEFYETRAQLTKRLIQEKGFSAIAIEGDWPDAYRVNRYVNEQSNDASADVALSGFRRFPTWMWRNTVIRDFVTWLYEWNKQIAVPESKVGFYGLDLYSLHTSTEAVIRTLERIDPEAAERAKARYACFDHFGPDPQTYGYMTESGSAEPCEEQVVKELIELQSSRIHGGDQAQDGNNDELFFIEQNARLVCNAEKYYRTMFRGRHSSWNLRDEHMMETLDHLVSHLSNKIPEVKVVIWAHNSHLGDARATDMGWSGQINLGQLIREAHTDEVYSIGFSTYQGTVTAAWNWDLPAQQRWVRPAIPESYESLLHQISEESLLLDLRKPGLKQTLSDPRLERAIGVVYRPETERLSHYFSASLSQQFDALIHIDTTQALEPLDRTEHWDIAELPETYPSGL